MPNMPRDTSPIELVPAVQTKHLASADTVQTIGTLVTTIANELGDPLSCETLVEDHPNLPFFLAKEQADFIVGAEFAPEPEDEGDVIKIMAYETLGQKLLNALEVEPPGVIQGEIDLIKLRGASELRARMSILNTGELAIRGSCFMKWHSTKPASVVSSFAEAWGLDGIWQMYIDQKRNGRQGRFNVSATERTAQRVRSRLIELANGAWQG